MRFFQRVMQNEKGNRGYRLFDLVGWKISRVEVDAEIAAQKGRNLTRTTGPASGDG